MNINFVLMGLAVLLIFSFWIYIYIIFYHLIRFGIGSQPKLLSAIIVLGSLLLFFIAVILFSNINWDNIGGQLFLIIKNSSFFSLTEK